MTPDNLIITLLIFLFLLSIILSIVAVLWFKKKEAQYESLVSEFHSRGYEVDTITKVASNLGAWAVYQKIIYFVRLYKGVKMYRDKKIPVQDAAYEFMQKKPSREIGWILQLNKFYNVIFVITAVFFILLFLFVNDYI